MHGTLGNWLEMGQKQLDFKYITHLSVIAQNQICIGFLCMPYLEKVIIPQCRSHLSMFYHLHLAQYILIN